jgi:hypothetical protein
LDLWIESFLESNNVRLAALNDIGHFVLATRPMHQQNASRNQETKQYNVIPLKLVFLVCKSDIESHDIQRLGLAKNSAFEFVAKGVIQVKDIRFEQVDPAIFAFFPNQFIPKRNDVLVFNINICKLSNICNHNKVSTFQQNFVRLPNIIGNIVKLHAAIRIPEPQFL